MLEGNIKLSYLNEIDIYYIDYSGTITYDKGLTNMKIIRNELQELSKNGTCLKLLFDLRNTVWQERETHDSLSRIARKIFNPSNIDYVLFTAILNNEYTGSSFENEHWFVNRDDAIKWLVEKE